MYNLVQKLVAEFVGTFTLCFIGIGAICADQALRAGNPAAAGLGLLGIAVAHGLAIGNMVTAMGHISGGHFNPAVTIGVWVTKRIGTLHAAAYVAAQLAGATTGAGLVNFALPADITSAARLGIPALGTGMTAVSAMVIEAAITFLLVWVVFASAVDEKGAFNKIAGYAIGLTITMDILLAGPFTGGAVNPARAFGPALITGVWRDHGVYWVGPLLGGAIAGSLYSGLMLRKQTEA